MGCRELVTIKKTYFFSIAKYLSPSIESEHGYLWEGSTGRFQKCVLMFSNAMLSPHEFRGDFWEFGDINIYIYWNSSSLSMSPRKSDPRKYKICLILEGKYQFYWRNIIQLMGNKNLNFYSIPNSVWYWNPWLCNFSKYLWISFLDFHINRDKRSGHLY